MLRARKAAHDAAWSQMIRSFCRAGLSPAEREELDRLQAIYHDRRLNQTIRSRTRSQRFIVTAERKFWRCVESGEPPRLFGVEPPKPRIQAVRSVDMSHSNAWAEFAGIFVRTRAAHLQHEQAKTELRSLMPEDAKEAIGHGIRAKRSKSGAVSFDLLVQEGTHAASQ
jgi:hypothetical protein